MKITDTEIELNITLMGVNFECSITPFYWSLFDIMKWDNGGGGYIQFLCISFVLRW